MANDAYLVTETPLGTKIEILRYPDFPLGSLLLEILVLNLAIIVLIVVVRWLLPFKSYGFLFFVLLGILAFPVYLIWNYRAKDSVELTGNVLRLKRHMPPYILRSSNLQKHEVKNLRVIQPDEKLAAFEGVFGLRLVFIQYRGVVAFETTQGMIVRFGWGLSNAEAEEIVSIIQEWLDEG